MCIIIVYSHPPLLLLLGEEEEEDVFFPVAVKKKKEKKKDFPKGVYTCHGHIDAALGVQSSARTRRRRRRQPASGNLKGTGDFYFIFIVFNWDTTSCVRDATKTTTTTNVR